MLSLNSLEKIKGSSSDKAQTKEFGFYTDISTCLLLYVYSLWFFGCETGYKSEI